MVLPSLARVGKLPLAQVSSFRGFPHHGLNLSAHILTLPILQLDFVSSAQCSDVALCLFFYQLLDEGSMVTFKIVINLSKRQGQFGHPLLYCLAFHHGSSL